MKFVNIVLLVLINALALYALSVPHHVGQFARRDEPGLLMERASGVIDLFKRKGGGGGGKGGGSGGSSSGGRSSGSGSSGSSSGASSSRSSNSGGRTSSGSGTRPAYGGGRYYSGGGSVPYTAGQRSVGGLAAVGLLGVGALAFWPGLWLYGAYIYPYPHPYSFYNASAGQNQTKPVECLCQQYSVCGCEDNTDSQYMNSLLGNGSTSGLNDTVVHVADVNGTSTILINGTLDNGTTAAGGSSSAPSFPAGGRIQLMGWVVILGTIAWSMLLL